MIYLRSSEGPGGGGGASGEKLAVFGKSECWENKTYKKFFLLTQIIIFLGMEINMSEYDEIAPYVYLEN